MANLMSKLGAKLRRGGMGSCLIAAGALVSALAVFYLAGAQPALAVGAPVGGALHMQPAAMLFSTRETDTATQGRQITVSVDGRHIPCAATGGDTVGRVLERLDIELGNLDIVEPAADARVEQGGTIRITRREYVIRKAEETLAFPVVASTSPDLKPGEEEIFVKGEPGLAITSYKCLVVDGVVTEETNIGREVISEPTTQEMRIGFRSVPISKLNFEWDFDESAEPIGYVKVLRDQRSSGYSARAGALTASGRLAVVGHVAVNPNVIPYGSKLFIQSSDGKYIYGYAIAADTGIALMDGRVALDCFYDTYEASANHGIKNVDIFVLE